MPHLPLHLYVVVSLVLALGSQLLMYRLAFRFLMRKKAPRKLTHLFLLPFFLIINSPLVFMKLDPFDFYHGFARTFIMIPFFAYETLSLGVVLVFILITVAKIPVRLLKRPATHSASEEPRSALSESRRSFIRKGAAGLGAYAFVGSLHSISDREDYKVDHVTLNVSDLPPKLDGLTISMISDIHSGLYMLEEDMQRYTEVVNDLKADMIFIPGDFVTTKSYEILPLAKAFSGLKSKYGTYACLGNHDFYANPVYITEKLRENGMKVLRNETDELDIEGARLMLSGVDDGHHADFPKVSFEARSLDTARILLCHKPYYFENAVAGGFDVMLSGHTHGGQIVLADFFGAKITPAALASPYISGRYKMGDSVMYVSRGIGTIGIPIRVNCPPEVTLFTLRAKPSQETNRS